MKHLLAPVLAIAFSACLHGDEFRYSHEHVLGTSLELHINARTEYAAQKAEARALAEIDRLNAILSKYDAKSELSKFAKAKVGQKLQISNELFDVLQRCDEWHHLSNGAFNPGVEGASRLWRSAAENQQLPSHAELSSVQEKINQTHWKLDLANQSATRLSECPLSLDGLAKGYVLDRAAAAALTANEAVDGVSINIGGDIRVVGQIQASVTIADPGQDAIGGRQQDIVSLTESAIATSGHSERSLEIQNQRVSHLLDPSTGQPTHQIASASVIAPTATTADALATVCSVLPISQSIALVNALSGVDCLLVANSGEVITSTNWPQSGRTGAGKADEGKADASKLDSSKTGHEMLVKFEIAKPASARRYRRPYVAVWIEDESRFPVKTLALFLMQNNPGPRWYRDVRRWYADDQTRQFVDERDMIKMVSKPTRNPGQYKVVWDGKDDDGKLLTPGKYTLLIEAAREHGSYQLIKQEFEFGTAIDKQLKGNAEISSASMDYKVDSSKKQK